MQFTGFDDYDKECFDIMIMKLRSTYANIKYNASRNLSAVGRMQPPVFDITDTKNRWGSWTPNKRIMQFSVNLVRNYEWGAVEHVMKHEMAHQIVSEVYHMDCYGVAHGEAWQTACGVVGIPPNRCESAEFLSEFKGTSDSPVVHKVRKLMVHASNEGATEEEAEIFMQKAQELMIRNDIKMSEVSGSDRVFVKRPLGMRHKRWATWMWSLGRLLSDHYHVENIRTRVGNQSYLELFGEPSNVDIAEYVGHALLTQAEYLYKKYKREAADDERERKATQRSEFGFATPKRGRVSKRAFMEGLFSGYSEKLSESTQATHDKIELEGAVIPTYNSKLLKEMYGDAYNMRSISYSGSQGVGGEAGRVAGKNMSLAQGVRGSGNRGLRIG